MQQTAKQVETLKDVNGLGRERPWRTHKMANEYIAMAYDSVNPDKAVRLRECAEMLSFVIDANGKKTLKDARFCRVRLCPMCTWRRSLKVASQMRSIMASVAESEEPLRYLFLTLTVRNCEADKLNETITEVLAAFNRLSKQLDFKRVVVGWYRGLEVTHNVDHESENFDTYHPHLHVVLGVNPTYFSGRHYVKQEDWTRMWHQAMRTDYAPMVDIRSVKGDTAAAVAEAAKYSTKAKDIIVPDDWDLTCETLRTLDAALHQRRLVAFGGRFKEIHAQLKLDDAETGDLVHTAEDATAEQGKVCHFAWYSGYRQYGRVE